MSITRILLLCSLSAFCSFIACYFIIDACGALRLAEGRHAFDSFFLVLPNALLALFFLMKVRLEFVERRKRQGSDKDARDHRGTKSP
jgi:hypothetical protein